MVIRLKNIQFYGYHGVNAHEREHGGKFEIDVEIDADLASATESDTLADTIDYVQLQQAVLYVASTKHFHLIEALSERIAEHILAQFPKAQIATVRVRKPGAALGGLLDTVEVECSKAR
jgi:dihydroneopterin aldolase